MTNRPAVVTNAGQRVRVRVWDGQRIFAEYIAGAAHAERYASALARRFLLPATIDPVSGRHDPAQAGAAQ